MPPDKIVYSENRIPTGSMVRFTRLGFHALVLDLHDIVILYDLRDVPEAGDDEFSVMWFDVVKFSLDMSESTAALLFLRDTACCQFSRIGNISSLLMGGFPEGSCTQPGSPRYLTGFSSPLQTVSAGFPVVDDILV